jgi:glycosyltransferase involved in cell wall biosynthesis
LNRLAVATPTGNPLRLAIVATHPIQYYAPWFQRVAAEPGIDLKVFYLWNFGVTEQRDHGFGRNVQWDLPLLDGYAHEFVENTSSDPGTHHFWGLRNPSLTARLLQFQPDAILSYGYNYASCQRLVWTWDRKGAPLIFRGDSHRLLRSDGPTEQIRRQWIQTVFRRFGAFLYVGEANRDYFRYHGVPDDKLFFTPHAVDNVRFIGAEADAREQAIRRRAELGIPPEQKVILFAGKFQPKKRPDHLIAAFIALNREDAVLVLVGDGEMEAALRAQAGAHPRIHFVPFQNQSLMPRTYALADLFVLPSQGRDETWGLAVNEAMCLGKPIIVSSQVGCAQDLVRPGENGLVFPAGDVLALTAALRDALSDSARLARWGERSREIISGYTYDRALDGLKQACQALEVARS